MVWIGFGLGLLLTVPLVMLASRRTARRVRRLERRAQAAERLAELGTLTSGLAHEIKNPLSTIGLNLQLLGESLREAQLPQPHASRVERRIRALTDEADRLRGILEDFLRFAGRIRLDVQSIDLNETIHQLVDFYHPQAEASGIHLRVQLDAGTGKLELDPTLFKQALLNLLINATQAMVEARYSDKPHGGSQDLILRSEADKDEVRVHVIDTGPGIAAGALGKVFQPYFTTKKGGTGLGLPTARRIADEHGGSLTVHSEQGKGTDFCLSLPRHVQVVEEPGK